MSLAIRKLIPPKGSCVNFGAVVDNVNLENLTGITFKPATVNKTESS